jgi:copper chaperone CopZ
MKNVLLLGLLLSSAAIYGEHHDQHGIENMHSHEGHIHNEMVNGKTLEVDAQRFDKFMIDIDNHVVAVVSVQGMVCDFCARGIEKTFGKDKRVSKIDVDLASGKVLLAFSMAVDNDEADITQKILNNGLNITEIQVVGK